MQKVLLIVGPMDFETYIAMIYFNEILYPEMRFSYHYQRFNHAGLKETTGSQ